MKDWLESLCKSLNGRVGYIIASEDGSLDIRRGADQVFPSASIIKLPVLWAIFCKIHDGKLDLSQKTVMRSADIVDGYGVLKNIHPGAELTMLDLCNLMIHYSDNIATNLLIEIVGMDYINEEIYACGLKHTTLQRKMMDVASKERGLDNSTSPSDMVILLRQYRDSKRISAELRAQMKKILLGQFCNNFLAHYMPPGFSFAHKTGDLPGTMHDVGYLYTPKGRLFDVAVMCTNLANNIDGLYYLNETGAALFSELNKQEM